jgi:hypothetical protein
MKRAHPRGRIATSDIRPDPRVGFVDLPRHLCWRSQSIKSDEIKQRLVELLRPPE